MMQD